MRFGLCRTLLALSVFSVYASASPVLWTLVGVAFNDGGTASGSFVYDANTNTYSSINMTTTAGSVRTSGATYHFVSGGIPANSSGVLTVTTAAPNQQRMPGFALFFS